MATKGQPPDRLRWKVRIVRGLYERGWTADRVRQLFRVIDWIIDLPVELQKEFRMNLNAIEKEKRMPYVTSVERLAREEGKLEGIVLGQIQLLAKLVGNELPSNEVLSEKSLSELQELLAELTLKFKSRN